MKNTTITSHAEAMEFLKGKRAPYTAARKISSNKYAVKQTNGDIAIQLYDTKIVVYHPDNTITINNGGWATQTTHRHINLHIPASYKVRGVKGQTVYTKNDTKEEIQVTGETQLQ